MTLITPRPNLDAERDALELGRTQLVAWVSGDLRQPLRNLQDLVESIDANVIGDPVELHQRHRHMLRQIERMSELLDDLAILARPDQTSARSGEDANLTGEFDLAYGHQPAGVRRAAPAGESGAGAGPARRESGRRESGR